MPGCATGEEAYSLAILMREQLDHLDGRAPKVQVFATDIDEPAIATARAGRYPATLLQGMSPERLSRHFVHGIDGSHTSQNLSGSSAPSRRIASRAIRRSPASTYCPVETFSSILTWNCRAPSFLHSIIRLSRTGSFCSAVPKP